MTRRDWPTWAALIAVTLLVIAYHQWLAPRVSVPYIGGDAYYVFAGGVISSNPANSVAVLSEQPGPATSLLYAAIFRAFNLEVTSRVFGSDGGLVVVDRSGSQEPFERSMALATSILCVLIGLAAWAYTSSLAAAVVAVSMSGAYTAFIIMSERGLADVPLALILTTLMLLIGVFNRKPSLPLAVTIGFVVCVCAHMRHQYRLLIFASTVLVLVLVLLLHARRMTRQSLVRYLSIAGSVVLCESLWLYYIGVSDSINGLDFNWFIATISPFAQASTDGWIWDSFQYPGAHPFAINPNCAFPTLTYRVTLCLTLENPYFALERLTAGCLKGDRFVKLKA